MLAVPGHKGLLGPQGTGLLYVRDGLSIKPLKQGGTGTFSHATMRIGAFRLSKACCASKDEINMTEHPNFR